MTGTDVAVLAGCSPGDDCTYVEPPGIQLWFVVVMLLGAVAIVVGLVLGVAWVRGRAVRRRSEQQEDAPLAPTS
jgi:heme/copper-type cytochrome/quinol oxidase subunit 2